MRHRKIRTRLSRQSAHRVATLRGLASAVLTRERIKTTHVKAKEAKKLIAYLITVARTDTVQARRKAFGVLRDRSLVMKLFRDVAPLFKNRTSGFTRIIPYNFRKGDGANMVFLELTERKPVEKTTPAKKPKKTLRPETGPVKPREPKKEPPKAAPKVEPKVREEKAVEEVKKEKAREETKKIEKQKGFLKKVKGFFRRRTNM